jgi:hypothetical protein
VGCLPLKKHPTKKKKKKKKKSERTQNGAVALKNIYNQTSTIKKTCTIQLPTAMLHDIPNVDHCATQCQSGNESWRQACVGCGLHVRALGEGVVADHNGYVFDQALGLFYHSETGYYYDPETGAFLLAEEAQEAHQARLAAEAQQALEEAHAVDPGEEDGRAYDRGWEHGGSASGSRDGDDGDDDHSSQGRHNRRRHDNDGDDDDDHDDHRHHHHRRHHRRRRRSRHTMGALEADTRRRGGEASGNEDDSYGGARVVFRPAPAQPGPWVPVDPEEFAPSRARQRGARDARGGDPPAGGAGGPAGGAGGPAEPHPEATAAAAHVAQDQQQQQVQQQHFFDDTNARPGGVEPPLPGDGADGSKSSRPGGPKRPRSQQQQQQQQRHRVPGKVPAVARGYRDRAAERRQVDGAQRRREPASASASRHGASSRRGRARPAGPDKTRLTAENNLGARLLERMGWRDGMGLGRDGHGTTEPIAAAGKPIWRGAGIGAERDEQDRAAAAVKRKQKQENRKENNKKKKTAK